MSFLNKILNLTKFLIIANSLIYITSLIINEFAINKVLSYVFCGMLVAWIDANTNISVTGEKNE